MGRKKRNAVYSILIIGLLLSVSRLAADFLFVVGDWNIWRVIFDGIDAFVVIALFAAVIVIKESNDTNAA